MAVSNIAVSNIAVALCLAGCASSASAQFDSAAALPEAERRPDGIAVDLSSEPPASVDDAESRDSIVTLRTPLGVAVARATLRAFFAAMVSEDIAKMSQVVDGGALVQDVRAKPPAGQAIELTTLWRRRFGKREYQLLSPELIYREGDVMTYRSSEIDALPLSVRYLPDVGAPMPTDLVLHVPIVTHTINNERYLGDDVFFWLRREGERFMIVRMAEDLPF
jgi:hypothetical protein